MSEGPGERQEVDLRRVLVADRGQGALRILRWAREAKVESVCLVSDEDGESVWPDALDYSVWIPEEGEGPWPDPQRVISAALDAGCDAIHPGICAASHNPMLVELLNNTGLAWAGPGQHPLGVAADRAIARSVAEELGIPVVPGSMPILDLTQGAAWLARVGVPASIRTIDALRGSPRIRIDNLAEGTNQLAVALEDGPVLLERIVLGAREIEVPVLADGSGTALALGDLEVSVRLNQRRLLAEAPAPGLSPARREELHRLAERLVKHLDWRGLATVRFLVPADGRPYFLLLRPGLQPWHGLTEALFQVDLVDAQMRIATGDLLRWGPNDLQASGHHIWLGLRAGGEGSLSVVPQDGLRRDLAIIEGDTVVAQQPLGSIVASGPTRQAAIVRTRAALNTDLLPGIPVETQPFVQLFDARQFWDGPVDRDAAERLLRACLPAPVSGED
jgi:acetyl/propionyl-CoA carboxylase alpha subunit